MLPTRPFLIPQVLITGSGSSERVGEESKKLGGRKALIVTDQVMVKLGVVEGTKKALDQNKIPFVVYDAVATEPTVDYVRDGLKVFKENGCDFLIAVGGGSPIDTAKAMPLWRPIRARSMSTKAWAKLPKKALPSLRFLPPLAPEAK